MNHLTNGLFSKADTFLLKQGHPGKEGQSGEKGALVSFKTSLFVYIIFVLILVFVQNVIS